MVKARAEGVSRRALANGTVVYDVSVRLGNGKMFRKRGYSGEREATTARDDARRRAATGQPVLDARTSRTTVADVAAGWLASKQSLAINSRRAYGVAWNALAPTFGPMRVVDLRASHVTDWLDASLTTLGTRTVSERLNVLRSVLDRAVADGLGLATNPARLVKMPHGQSRGHRRIWAPKSDDVTAMIDHAPERYQIMFVLCVGLGLRSGEARALTMDRIDFATGAVTIDRQMIYSPTHDWGGEWHHGGHGLTAPKHDSKGTVTASQRVLDAISDHVERFGTGPLGLVVTSPSGAPMGESTWTGAVKRIRAKAGLPTFKGHELRHAYASWALANGATVAEVAADLRHADVGTTVRAYLRADDAPTAARSDGVMDRLARKPRARGHLRAV